MNMLTGIAISDGTLPFRIAIMEAAAGTSRGLFPDWTLVAADAVAFGLDGAAMVELASQYSDVDSVTLRRLVVEAGEEIGLRLPSQTDAVRCLGLIICRATVEELIPLPTPLYLIAELTERGALDWDLYLAFVSLHEWDDSPWRDVHREVVLASAQELLDESAVSVENLILASTGGAALPA